MRTSAPATEELAAERLLQLYSQNYIEACNRGNRAKILWWQLKIEVLVRRNFG